MSVTNTVFCYKCNYVFAELDSPIKCDDCKLPIHNKCLDLTLN